MNERNGPLLNFLLGLLGVIALLCLALFLGPSIACWLGAC